MENRKIFNPALGYTSKSQITKEKRPELEPTWVSRGMKDKHPYLCLKSFEAENEFIHHGFPAMGRPFIGPFGSTYNETLDLCKGWVKGARYYQPDICMKFFPEELTFTQER